MNFIQNKVALTVAFAAVVLMASCSTEPRQKPIEGAPDYVRRENQPSFTVPNAYSSMKTDVLRIDINRDGYDDAVMTVLSSPLPDAPGEFDSVFVYEYAEPSGSFARTYGVPVFYGVNVETLDMNADEHPEILVYTNAGGNDPTISRGLTVIGFSNGSYSTAVQLDGGDPEIATVDAGGRPVVSLKVYSEYWPDMLSHAESVRYLDSLIVLREIPDSVRAAVERQVFRQALDEVERDYARAKNAFAERQDDEAAYNAYSAAVRAVKYYRKLGMEDRIRSFRSQEMKFWRGALPEENANVLNQLTSPGSSS